jgi:hypothetical protein
MSDAPLGRYHFLSWVRRGIGASIANKDNNGSLPSRASLSVQLSLDVQQGGATNTVLPQPMNVELFGPGDIIGLIQNHIIKTEPRNFTVNFEPNYLCGIEFDSPDLPWLFTPAAPNGDRLRPWLALIALKPDELKLPSVAPNPLPTVEVQTMSALQDLSDSWNWAHVQVSGDTPVAEAMSSAPGNVISRLICPRRLEPETHYKVFLVPAFDIGIQKCLGKDVSAIQTTGASWNKNTSAPLTLPFYYQFEFNTSDEGDFESLVRRLTPRVLPAEVGERPVDVTTPAPHISSAGTPLGLEGALHSVLTQPTPWNDPDKTNFQSDVQAFINHPQTATDDPANPNPDDPVIAPPIYGRWHAAVQSVDRTAAGWVNDLNLDPRNRSAGGMGTQVVQEERTQLMASAWQQVDGVRKANDLLRQAQLARAVLLQLHLHELQPAPPETLMTLTAPLHSKLLASPTTVLATIRGSRVPERLLSGTFRRVTRPRRRRGSTPQMRTALLNRVNSADVTIVPASKPPGGMVSIDQISDNIVPGWVKTLSKYWNWILVALVVLLALAVVLVGAFAGAVAAAVVAVAAVAAAAAFWPAIRNLLQKAQAANDLSPSNFTPSAVTQAPPNPKFAVTTPGTAPASGGTGGDSTQASAFRSATTDLFTAFQEMPVDPPMAPALDFAALKATVLTRIDPRTTVPRRVQYLINFSARFTWQAPDLLEPIMAAPEFPQPMYAPLRDLSPDYVLPGVELVPPETVGILLANHAFIEGYMVGLNHEMARQLLWNDYPTDQRGSYFRQFWDVSAYVPQKGDPTDAAQLRELLKDIPPVHTWPKPLPLGQHPNRTDVVENNVVLLVRGELFKRYPNAIVYAGKAKRASDGTRVLDESDERYPIFRGTLPTDITFLGFNLSLDDARGGTHDSPEGFFFVFQQQPSEPRFGLEPNEDATPIAHWAELAWTNFASAQGGGGNGGGVFKLPNLGNTTRGTTIARSPWRLSAQVFSLVLQNVKVPDFLSSTLKPIRVSIPPGGGNPALPDYTPDDPNNDWGVNSAQTAYILLRLPFRILIHADLMLPS